ncbi:hypothetical protein F2Q69_00017994 [Brassica cretica]|uniref:Uncharacterized protein n=1 Tax=Brassica cretica TaxID=69181 RepID=A0A8S9R2D3_BRACR|nr:hypothetical protein F2Q69_00017994 [Brassica cretica]
MRTRITCLMSAFLDILILNDESLNINSELKTKENQGYYITDCDRCSSLSFLPNKKIRLLRSGTRRCRRFNPLTLPLLFLLPFSPSVFNPVEMLVTLSLAESHRKL